MVNLRFSYGQKEKDRGIRNIVLSRTFQLKREKKWFTCYNGTITGVMSNRRSQHNNFTTFTQYEINIFDKGFIMTVMDPMKVI